MIDKAEVESRLSTTDTQKVLRSLGFDFSESTEGKNGWRKNVRGPRTLGEGGTPNFAVNLQTGAIHDHGSGPNGWRGDLWKAVMHVRNCTFLEAVEYVADKTGIEIEEKTDWNPFEDGREVERYPYVDDGGNLLYYRVRFEPNPSVENPDRPKKFLPKTPGEGWSRGPDPVLYRLPEVKSEAAKGTDGAVFIVEGEKDVHTLEDAEDFPYVATTSGSAGSWRDRFTRHVEGARVVILPDNDSDGRDYAEAVARSCKGVAASVRVVELDVAPGGDVSDWIGGEGTVKTLLQEARDTDEWTPRTTANGAPSGDGRARGVPAVDTEPFWYFDAEKETVKIDRAGLIQFLEAHGFGKLYAESDLESMLVRVEDNIVRRSSRERIKDFTLQWVQEQSPKRGPEVVDALLRGANVYFSSALFEFLSPVEPGFHRDTAESAFFYYKNRFVEVTADGFELRPYDELDGVIWDSQIIDRKFSDLTDETPTGWEWHQHLLNVTGHETERHNALCTALGYLMHGYKDPAVTKAIIFMDEKVTDVEEGRTGKSVTTQALQHMGSTLRIDGRNFSFDSRFAFQEVTLDTAVVDFNDAKKRFPFERLFSLITDDFPVERKGKDRVTIPFKDSPKFTLSTNYVIEGKGASFDDRTFQIEFADYYGPKHSPKDEFGHRLFDDWGRRKWAEFDNVMMACVRQYLRDGLASYDHVNVREKKLRQETCPDFAEWIRDFIELGRRYDKKALKRSFQEAYSPDYEDMTGYQCTTWVKTFARIYDLEVSEPKSGSTLYIVLRDPDTE
jgi:hypothetical protein